MKYNKTKYPFLISILFFITKQIVIVILSKQTINNFYHGIIYLLVFFLLLFIFGEQLEDQNRGNIVLIDNFECQRVQQLCQKSHDQIGDQDCNRILENMLIILVYYNQNNVQRILMSEQPNDNHQQGIEEYLQKLMKKITHQVKNPFNLPITTFEFQQLHGWKNAVIQLDNSTKIYGLRVDHYHQNVLKIVNHVTRNNQNVEHSIQHLIHKQQTTNLIHLNKHLDQSTNITSDQTSQQHNYLLWKNIFIRCDNISKLMLNTLPINHDLIITLDPNYHSHPNYRPSRYTPQHQSIKTHSLLIFNQIQQITQQSLININNHKKNNKTVSDEQMGNWDAFYLQDYEKVRSNHPQNQDLFNDMQFLQNPYQYNQLKRNNVLIKQHIEIIQQQETNHQQHPIRHHNYISNPYLIENIKWKDRLRPRKPAQKIISAKKSIKQHENQFVEFNIESEKTNQILYPNKKYVSFKANLLPMDLSIGFPSSQLFLISDQLINKRKSLIPKYALTQQQTNEFHTSFQELSQTLPNIDMSKAKANFSIKNIKKQLKGYIKKSRKNTLNNLISKYKQYQPIDIFASLLHLAHQNQFYLVRKQRNIAIENRLY